MWTMFKRIEGTISCKCVRILSRHIKDCISCVVLTEYISLESEGNGRYKHMFLPMPIKLS